LAWFIFFVIVFFQGIPPIGFLSNIAFPKIPFDSAYPKLRFCCIFNFPSATTSIPVALKAHSTFQPYKCATQAAMPLVG
jgi:hypothetical protein